MYFTFMRYFVTYYFILIIKLSWAQLDNYQSYYSQIYIAEMEKFNGDFQKSFISYKSAFENYFPFQKDLLGIIKVSDSLEIKVGLTKEQKEYINLIRNFNEIFYSNDIFRNYKIDSTEFLKFKKHFKFIKQDDFCNISEENFYIVSEIQQMLNTDQFIRKIKKSTFKDSLLIKVDKENNIRLRKLINQYGYPNQRELGITGSMVYTLLLHITISEDLTSFEDSLLNKQVICGNLPPENYAKLIDRFNVWKLSGKQVYGTWILNGVITKEEIQKFEDLDIRRKNIFLEPFSEYCKKNHIRLL